MATGPNFNGQLFSAQGGASGYYKDARGVWWLITRRQDAIDPLKFEWETAIVLNPGIYIASDGRPIQPGWSSGTSSSAQAAVDHIDAFALRYKLQRGKGGGWLWLVVAYLLLKGRRR